MNELRNSGTVDFAFLLKTFADDRQYVERLIDSYHRHNRDGIGLYVVCPAGDRPVFEQFAGDAVSVICEEDVTSELVNEPVSGIRPGYVNQEIVKLAFGGTGLARNYMCLDSDGMFIRDFRYGDFMFDATTPYTVMFEDNELRTDRDYFDQHWEARAASIDAIRVAFGMPAQPLLTCHGFGIFSSLVLQSLREEFMAPRALSWPDLIAISPYEFSWYTLYARSSGVIPVCPRESLFRYVHTPRQLYMMALAGTTVEDLARGYVGLTVNSNFSRDFGLASLDDAAYKTLGRYVSFVDLGRAAVTRAGEGARLVGRNVMHRTGLR